MQREYAVVYEQGENGWIVATVPELPGAVSQGRTMEEARLMIADAVRLLLLVDLGQASREAPPHGMWETLTVEVDLDKDLAKGK